MADASPQPPPKNIDVGSQVGGGAIINWQEFDITAKTPEDDDTRKHRHAKEMKKLEHGHAVEMHILRFVGFVISAMVLCAIGIVIWSNDSEIRKMASQMLLSIVTAAIAFIGGRGSMKLDKAGD